MRILVTGASGRCGRILVPMLLAEGHEVVGTDRPSAEPLNILGMTYIPADLGSLGAVDALFRETYGGVIHLGAIPQIYPHIDDREVHNNNVVASYNVLRTAVDHGVKRIVQASSVNAHGLSYAPPGHTKFSKFPITEEVERRPEDAYAVSKEACENQATAMVRLVPDVRIASLRPHMVRDDYASSFPDCRSSDLFAWVSYEAVARMCVLGLTSEGWSGHEVFNCVAPEHCWEGTVEQQRTDGVPGDRVHTVDLLKRYWPDGEIDEAYFAENPRRSVWDSTKAERMLGWRHG